MVTATQIDNGKAAHPHGDGAFGELEAGPEDLEGLVDYPRGVEGTEVALLFRRTNNGATKVSLRSNGPVDVNAVAREFGGGGHVRAAGATLDLSLEESISTVVSAARSAVDRTRTEGD